MRALVGSIGIHVAVGIALIAVRSDAKREEPDTASIELVDHAVDHVDHVDRVIDLVELVTLDSGGGGSQRTAVAPPAKVEQTARVDRATRREIVRAMPTERAQSDATSSLSDSLASIASSSTESIAGDGGDGGDGGGRGGGHGRGIGRGVGEGLGDRANAGDNLPSVPAAPKASKARKAKLIYPTRERDVSEGQLYTARVTIDTDGYVVGARLLQVVTGPKDSDASAMIFKFRYAPALDDDGKPIKSTLEQPFLVQ